MFSNKIRRRPVKAGSSQSQQDRTFDFSHDDERRTTSFRRFDLRTISTIVGNRTSTRTATSGSKTIPFRFIATINVAIIFGDFMISKFQYEFSFRLSFGQPVISEHIATRNMVIGEVSCFFHWTTTTAAAAAAIPNTHKRE